MDFGIGYAIWCLTYDIFVRGPLYIVHGIGDAIFYLSGQKLIDKIFGTNGHFFNMPPYFLIFLGIAITLIILFGGGVILHAMVKKNIGSAITGLANRTLMVILLMVLIPLFFWIINFTVISIIHIIMPQLLDGRNFADMIGALGFTDKQNQTNWHYDIGYPDWNNYSLFLGFFGSIACLFIFFYLGLSLIQHAFNLFLLYIISPVVFATATSGAKWQKVNLWKDLVIGRFVSTLGIVLSLTLFLTLEPLMFAVATDVSDTWMGQATFKLLFIVGGAIATLKMQELISSMAGTVGVMEEKHSLASNKIKARTSHMLGAGKRFIFSKNKMMGNSKHEVKSSIANPIKSGGIGRTASFTNKTNTGSVLATAGLIGDTSKTYKAGSSNGSKKLIQSTAKQLVKPISSLDTVLKTSKKENNKGE